MLFDIGIGIMLALLTGKIFALHAGWRLIGAGIFFSLFMDADAVINFIAHHGTEDSYEHRNLLHVPLLYMPVGLLILLIYQSYRPGEPYLLVLFFLCSLAHLIHDSIGIGWGVRWLYPFTRDQYSFLYQYNAHKAGLKPGTNGIYVWKFGEIEGLEKKYGDKHWFRKIYLSVHPYAAAELAVFLLAVATLFLYTNR